MKELLIIDMQLGFVNSNTKHLIPRIEKAQYDFDIVHVFQFHNTINSYFIKLIDWKGIQKQSEAYKLSFEPRKSKIYYYDKEHFSVLKSNPFKDYIKKRKGEKVYLSGIGTDICILKSAVDLIEFGCIPIVLSDLCASHKGTNYHLEGLELIKRFIGSKQIESYE